MWWIWITNELGFFSFVEAYRILLQIDLNLFIISKEVGAPESGKKNILFSLDFSIMYWVFPKPGWLDFIIKTSRVFYLIKADRANYFSFFSLSLSITFLGKVFTINWYKA